MELTGEGTFSIKVGALVPGLAFVSFDLHALLTCIDSLWWNEQFLVDISISNYVLLLHEFCSEILRVTIISEGGASHFECT